MQKEEKWVNSSDINLWTQLLCGKQPAKEACILISGAGASALFWSDYFCSMLVASGYNVIRFDHRDCGLSDAVDWDVNPYTVADLADDVISIMDAYLLDRAHVAGHSMGGTIVQWLAIQYAQRLISYTSLSVATGTQAKPPSEETMKALMENKPTQDFKRDLPGFMRSWEILNAERTVDKDVAISYTRDLYERSKHVVGVAWNHINCQQDFDLSDQLPSIVVPGLFIHGEKDPLILLEGAVATQAMVPNSKMIIIPGMGHMFFQRECEQEIVGYLTEHFNRYKVEK